MGGDLLVSGRTQALPDKLRTSYSVMSCVAEGIANIRLTYIQFVVIVKKVCLLLKDRKMLIQCVVSIFFCPIGYWSVFEKSFQKSAHPNLKKDFFKHASITSNQFLKLYQSL